MEQTVVTILYFTIGFVALGLALISFLVGEVTEFVDDVTSPIGDWLGDHLPFDHDHEVGFSKFVNAGATLGFLAGFGFTAAFTMASFSIGALPAAGTGILGGVALGGLLGALWFALKRSEATSSYSAQALVGVEGVVAEKILRNGKGRVTCVVNDMKVWHTAQAVDGGEIPEGVPVMVKRAVGNTIYVTPTAGNPPTETRNS